MTGERARAKASQRAQGALDAINVARQRIAELEEAVAASGRNGYRAGLRAAMDAAERAADLPGLLRSLIAMRAAETPPAVPDDWITTRQAVRVCLARVVLNPEGQRDLAELLQRLEAEQR